MNLSDRFQPFFFDFFLRLKKEAGMELDIVQYEAFLTCWLTHQTTEKKALFRLCETIFLTRSEFRPAFERIFEDQYTLYDKVIADLQKTKIQDRKEPEVKAPKETETAGSSGKQKSGNKGDNGEKVPPLPIEGSTIRPEEPQPVPEKAGWPEVSLMIRESSGATSQGIEDASRGFQPSTFILLPEKTLPFSLRKTTQMWRKVATHFSTRPTKQVDVQALTRQLIEDGFIHRLDYETEKVENQKIVWLSDHEGSMSPFASWENFLLQAITNTPPTVAVEPHTSTFDRYFFHDYPMHERNGTDFQLFLNRAHTKTTTWLEALKAHKWDQHTLVILFSDAAAARRKLDFDRVKVFYDLCTLIRRTTSRLLWINPVKETEETSARYISYFVPMVYPDDVAFKRFTSRLPVLPSARSEDTRPTPVFQDLKTDGVWDTSLLPGYETLDALHQTQLEAFWEVCPSDTHWWMICHAAFPVALTSDLLRQIWLNFQADEQGNPFKVPLWVVDEILHSPLVRELEQNLYELYPTVREILLNYLLTKNGLEVWWGVAREWRLATFMEKYLAERRAEVPTPAVAAAETINYQTRTLPSSELTERINTLLANSQNSQAKAQRFETLSQIEYLLSVARHHYTNENAPKVPDSLQGLQKLTEGIRLAEKGTDRAAILEAFREARPYVEESRAEEAGFKVKLPPEVQAELLMESVSTESSGANAAAKPTHYALLVGINQYQQFPVLNGCLNDCEALENYLITRDDFDVELTTLTDRQATRQAIINTLRSYLDTAQAHDTVLFYFAGYGAREKVDALWHETDNALDCLVCFDSGLTRSADFLLADKELRFLIHELSEKTKAHIVTIFDCSYPTRNSRNGALIAASYEDVQERGITDGTSITFPQRGWEEFVFSKIISYSYAQDNNPDNFLPQGKHIHISACESDQVAVEIDGEGVFTKTLVRTLIDSGGNLSYTDLMGQVRQYMQASYEQTPGIFIPLETERLIQSGFLNRPLDPQKMVCEATYHMRLGWQLNAGAIHGLKPYSNVTLIDPAQPDVRYEATIPEGGIYIDYAFLIVEGPDPELAYKADVPGLTSRPFKLELRNHDGNPSEVRNLINALQQASVYCVFSDRHQADFTLHFRSGEAYFTFPDSPYQPLIRPIEVINTDPEDLVDCYQHISRWHFIKNLHNEDKPADLPDQPLAIELSSIQKDGSFRPIRLNNDTAELQYEQIGNDWEGTIQIRLTNTTEQSLFVWVGYLSKEFQCFIDFLPQRVQLLEGGASVLLGPNGRDQINLRLGEVELAYNWSQTREALKFIISTEPFDAKTLQLEEIPSPLLPNSSERGFGYQEKGASRGLYKDETNLFFSDWLTQTLHLEFRNPDYNRIPAQTLWSMLEWQETAYFAARLYCNIELDTYGMPTVWRMKEGITVHGDNREVFEDFKTGLGSRTDLWQRRKRYQKLRMDRGRLPLMALGDSWFHYPMLVQDTIEHLYKRYAILSFAEAGSSLADALKQLEREDVQSYFEPYPEGGISFLLVSLGLADLLGEDFPRFLNSYSSPESSAPTLLNEKFYEKLAQLSDQFGQLFSELTGRFDSLHILVHCYDYFTPLENSKEEPGNSANWIGKNLTSKGIASPEGRMAVMRVIVDEFAGMLQALIQSNELLMNQVTLVDTRGLVARNEWYDELHPNNEGFRKIANAFMQEIERIHSQKTMS